MGEEQADQGQEPAQQSAPTPLDIPPPPHVTVAHALLDGLVTHVAGVLEEDKLPDWEKHWHEEATKFIDALRQWFYKL